MLTKKIIRMALTAVCVAIFVAAGAGRVVAHHGWSEYDNNRTINLTGQIQTVSYQNPHVTIQLETKNGEWLAVLAPPSRMQRRGLPLDQLQVGETLSVVGYPHRSESGEMRAERLTIGKKKVELR